MTLREKILKTFVVTIREINAHGGPEEFYKKYPVGGMYFAEVDGPYDENGKEIGSGMPIETLEYCRKVAPHKFLICADEAFMRGQTLVANQRSLGAAADEELAYEYGKMLGMQANENGVDWMLVPSIDMYFNSSMPLTAVSDDPILTAKLYRQVIRGIQDQGVCATVKHFPGLGTDHVNMHHAPGRNVLPFDKWMETYGYTYKETMKENPMCVMTTHTTLLSYDNEMTDGYYPIATYSKKLTEGLLRQELGFQGAVVTDALIMGGMATGNLVEETAQAFKCGADLLLWPPVEAADRIEELILSGEIPMSRLDEALNRIDVMFAFRNHALKEHGYDEPSLAYVEDVSRRLTEHGICCLKNEYAMLPLDAEKHKRVLLVDATDKENCKSIPFLKEELEARGIRVTVSKGDYDKLSEVCWQSDADSLQEGQNLVIFNLNAEYLSSWNNAFMTIWNSHMFDKRKKLIINYGSPFFAPECFPEDPTIVEMNCDVSRFAIKSLLERLFGEKPFTGKPVLHNKNQERIYVSIS